MAQKFAADTGGIEQRLELLGVDFVRFEQSDTHGISRSKTVPHAHVAHFARHGLNFLLGHLGFDVQGRVASGTGVLEELGFPDSLIFPDLDTFAPLPWADATGRVICEPRFYDGREVAAAPRTLARRQLAALAALGYELKSGFEYEFYLQRLADRTPPFKGIQIFATLRNTFDEALVNDLLRSMTAVGVDIITCNAEYGPGQMEINFAPALGIRAADNAFTFKTGIKEIARQHAYAASFMTRPYADQSSSGCHYHQSLMRVGDGGAAFSDPTAPDGLSDVCRHFIAGQLEHAAALTALFAPTVNCGKRFRDFSFAPVNVSWGHENRTVAIRIKGRRGDDTHVENRVPCGSSNPYLVMAGSIAAGIDGIQRKLPLPPAIEGLAYGRADLARLPNTLAASLDALEADAVLRDMLGPEFIKLFLAVKRHEMGLFYNIPDFGQPAFLQRVDAQETDEYFEFL